MQIIKASLWHCEQPVISDIYIFNDSFLSLFLYFQLYRYWLNNFCDSFTAEIRFYHITSIFCLYHVVFYHRCLLKLTFTLLRTFKMLHDRRKSLEWDACSSGEKKLFIITNDPSLLKLL